MSSHRKVLSHCLRFFQWPQMALCRLCGLFQAVGAAVSAAQHACLFRLENIIIDGLCVNTNYSGMDMPMLALEMMLQQWVHLGLCRSDSGKVRAYSASDINAGCRRVLQTAPIKFATHQVCGDIMDRLLPHIRKEIEKLRPA